MWMPGVFYGQPDNPDQLARFAARTSNSCSLGYTDPDARTGSRTYSTKAIPQKANGWKANNIGRCSDPKFDAISRPIASRTEPGKARHD